METAANQRRQQQQQRGRSPESGARNYRRGLSSPAELRRALSPGGGGGVPRGQGGHRQGPLPPPPLHQLPHGGRRARSPEGLRRSSSRVGASSPAADPAAARGRVLRREKTSMFDSRYPSLDNQGPNSIETFLA